METKYYENGDKTTIIEYRFVGYGKDAQAVFQKIKRDNLLKHGIGNKKPLNRKYKAFRGY